MFERLKKALVETYVGAIAIGWMIANAAIAVANAFASPILDSFRQHLDQSLLGLKPSREPIEWQLVYPGLISAAIQLAIGYGLLRWLYFAAPPPVQDEPEPDVPTSVPD